MRPVRLGAFHRIRGFQACPAGLSLYDIYDVEHFIEIKPHPDHDLLVEGAFGTKPEEGGFQPLEGMMLRGVRSVSCRPQRLMDTHEVRELEVQLQDGPSLSWDIYVPRTNQ